MLEDEDSADPRPHLEFLLQIPAVERRGAAHKPILGPIFVQVQVEREVGALASIWRSVTAIYMFCAQVAIVSLTLPRACISNVEHRH